MGMLSVIKNLPRVLRQGGGKIIFKLQKNKPQLLFATGVVVAVGGFVWAVVNARKIDSVIEEGENAVNDIQFRIDEASNPENDLDKKQRDETLIVLDKEMRSAKRSNIMKMILLMGVPCLVFSGGICLIIGGFKTLFVRFGEVSMALASLQEIFDRYRRMNIEEHGEECDRRYRYGIVGETEIETMISDPNGDEQTVKCKVPIVDKDRRAALYSFEFSENFTRKCPKDPVCTISYLRSSEKYWNTWMESTGKPVTLNMILDDLGIILDPDDPMNDYILVAGWRPNGDGDNKIDYGIMRAINKPALDMLSNTVMLNFNCDGNIYHSVRYTKDGRKVC